MKRADAAIARLHRQAQFDCATGGHGKHTTERSVIQPRTRWNTLRRHFWLSVVIRFWAREMKPHRWGAKDAKAAQRSRIRAK